MKRFDSPLAGMPPLMAPAVRTNLESTEGAGMGNDAGEYFFGVVHDRFAVFRACAVSVWYECAVRLVRVRWALGKFGGLREREGR
jgi:hypothetical protein